MADLTKITNFEIFRWRAKTTEFVEAGAAIIKHDTALPGIDGNFFIAVDDINGNPIEAYVPAGAATDTQLGTTLLPLQWQPATGTDIAGAPENGGRIPAKKEMRTVVSKTLLLQTLQALKKEIGSSLKLNSAFDFIDNGVSNWRTFATTGERDLAFPNPVGKTEYNGFNCTVGVIGATEVQIHNGANWIALGISTSVISSWKSPPARVATTANVDIATELKVGDTIDNIVLEELDTVLVWMNTLKKENGLYVVSGSNPATRRDDFNIGSEATSAALAVAEGDTYADQIFLCISNNPLIDTDDVDFVRLETAPIASEAEAIAGLENTKMMTSLRTKQSIEANQNISDADATTLTGDGSADSLHTHPIIQADLKAIRTIADATPRLAADGEETQTADGYFLVKAITVWQEGTMRVKFELKTNDLTNPVRARIYKNGGALGTDRTATTSYVTHSQDFTFAKNDSVELWAYRNNSYSAVPTVRNFRISYSKTAAEGQITNP